MGLKIKILAFLIGLIFFFFVLRFIKKNSFRPTYAFLWISISLFLLSIPVLEMFYKWIAVSLIGIVDARHIIYIVLIGFLLIYVFYLTSKISQMSDQVQVLISHAAILEKELKELAMSQATSKRMKMPVNSE
jgi:hypothetical protein